MSNDYFTIIETSYRHGEYNSSEKYLCKTEEGRDKMFEEMRQDYIKRGLKEYVKDNFEDGGKWSYELIKGQTTLTIYP